MNISQCVNILLNSKHEEWFGCVCIAYTSKRLEKVKEAKRRKAKRTRKKSIRRASKMTSTTFKLMKNGKEAVEKKIHLKLAEEERKKIALNKQQIDSVGTRNSIFFGLFVSESILWDFKLFFVLLFFNYFSAIK